MDRLSEVGEMDMADRPTSSAPSFDGIISRLLKEAEREFPGWRFARRDRIWVAVSGKACVAGTGMAEVRSELREYLQLVADFPAWRIWRGRTEAGLPGDWYATCRLCDVHRWEVAPTVAAADLAELSERLEVEEAKLPERVRTAGFVEEAGGQA